MTTKNKLLLYINNWNYSILNRTVVILKITIVTLALIISWFSLLPYAMFAVSPFAWAEADLDKNGFISPSEADYFANYGKRIYNESGNECVEFYALKDGLTLKKQCK